MVAKLNVRERLISSAAELFYSQGVAATGIDKITAHAGVAKMSLYNNFSSKADLVEAYVQTRTESWLGYYAERIAAAQTAEERVLAVFDSYIDQAALSEGSGFRGCGLLNAAAELVEGDRSREVAAAQKRQVVGMFSEHLTEMGLGASSVDEVAQHLTFLLEGAMALAGLDGKDDKLKAARKIATTVLRKL